MGKNSCHFADIKCQGHCYSFAAVPQKVVMLYYYFCQALLRKIPQTMLNRIFFKGFLCSLCVFMDNSLTQNSSESQSLRLVPWLRSGEELRTFRTKKPRGRFVFQFKICLKLHPLNFAVSFRFVKETAAQRPHQSVSTDFTQNH